MSKQHGENTINGISCNWSMEAADCLKQVYDYIARDNLTAAHKVVAGICDKVQMACVIRRATYTVDSSGSLDLR